MRSSRYNEKRVTTLPLYEYECSEHGRFEVMQKFSDAPLTKCPKCGRPVQKLLSAPAIQFKGSGWYVTDYARKSSGDGKKDGDGKAAEAKDASAKQSGSSASKSPSGGESSGGSSGGGSSSGSGGSSGSSPSSSS
jgi:putative FmdB family regulatory protein